MNFFKAIDFQGKFDGCWLSNIESAKCAELANKKLETDPHFIGLVEGYRSALGVAWAANDADSYYTPSKDCEEAEKGLKHWEIETGSKPE